MNRLITLYSMNKIQKYLKWKYLFILVIIIGLIVPFVDYFTIIEMFFLLIPFGIIVSVSFVYWIVSLFNAKMNSQKSFFIFLIIPLFAFAQILSGFSADKIQLYRSNRIIADIEKIYITTNEYPERYEINFGIAYDLLDNGNRYKISYSRGFMVTEKYYSDIKKWKSYGWND